MENNTLELSLLDSDERQLVEYIYNAIPAQEKNNLTADDILLVLDLMDDYLEEKGLLREDPKTGENPYRAWIEEDVGVVGGGSAPGSVLKNVVVKVGGEGAYFDSADEGCALVSGFHVSHIVDTVGAGDGFAAGVLSARAEGLSWYNSVRRGNAIGAIQIMSVGDNDGLPTRAELEKFMETDEH